MTVRTLDEAQTEGVTARLPHPPTSPPAHGRWRELARRNLLGLAMAATYGVAIGLRQGGVAIGLHAFGVPFGLLLAALLGVPSMFVFLSMCRSPIDAHDLASSATEGLGSAGLLLLGLSPAAALFVVTSETPQAAAHVVAMGLLASGGVALVVMTADVLTRTRGARPSVDPRERFVIFGFAVFAVLLVGRLWHSLLPILGGAS